MKLILITILFISSSYGKVRDFSTTRLSSLGNTGLASLLLYESSILNPASIAFSTESGLYFQKSSSDLTDISKNRIGDFDNEVSDVIIASDTSGSIKGSLLYQHTNANYSRRNRLASSLSAPIGKDSSIGFLYEYTIDGSRQISSDVYHRLSVGYLKVFSPKFSIGAKVQDLFLNEREDQKAGIGLQYIAFDIITFLFDSYISTQNDLNSNHFGLQLQVNESSFFRLGNYYDQILNEKGLSWGFAWFGPKLSLEFSSRTLQSASNFSDYLSENEKVIESSLSLSVRM